MTANTRCIMCGRPLSRQTRPDRTGPDPLDLKQVPTGRLGYEGNGYFCTLRCGYAWALREVEVGLAV